MGAGFFRQELGRNLKRSPLSHVGSLVMAAALFAFFDLLWIGSQVADRYFVELMSGIQMEIFFADEVSEADFDSRVAGLRGIEGIERVEVITKDAARQRLGEALGADYLTGSQENPLPRSARLSFKEGFPGVESLAALKRRFSGVSGVLQVSYDEQWMKNRADDRSAIAGIARALLGAALAAAMLNAALLTGLIVRAKTRHFAQLRMMGAGPGFMGSPLIFEGAALAAFAAALSWIAILVAQNELALPRVDEALPEENAIALMIAAAAIVGGIGSYLAVKVAAWRSR